MFVQKGINIINGDFDNLVYDNLSKICGTITHLLIKSNSYLVDFQVFPKDVARYHEHNFGMMNDIHSIQDIAMIPSMVSKAFNSALPVLQHNRERMITSKFYKNSDGKLICISYKHFDSGHHPIYIAIQLDDLSYLEIEQYSYGEIMEGFFTYNVDIKDIVSGAALYDIKKTVTNVDGVIDCIKQHLFKEQE